MKQFRQDEIEAVLAAERSRFVQANPKSRDLAKRSAASLVAGVPMQWMVAWPGDFPIFFTTAIGARIVDVDSHSYVDMCLGDTGAMFAHSPAILAQAIAEQARRGMTALLPMSDGIWVAEELSRRFGLPYWQFALSATDANRFALRIAREVTGRPRIIVFNGCYHGTVDETIVSGCGGATASREGNLGPAYDPSLVTRAVEFNDLGQLERALAPHDVACLLCEPALTNHHGIVLPDPGYHAALREATRRHGTLLVIDETHTISTGPAGYTGEHGLAPDMLTLGKAIGGGLPAAVFGMSEAVAQRLQARTASREAAVAGIGGTLAANALSVRAMRATLEHLMTMPNYAHMTGLASRLEAQVQTLILGRDLPWYVTRLGCRVEYRFQAKRPSSGAEAAAGVNPTLDRLLHLYLLNRGLLMTPMHSMILISPETTDDDVDLHGRLLTSFVDDLW